MLITYKTCTRNSHRKLAVRESHLVMQNYAKLPTTNIIFLATNRNTVLWKDWKFQELQNHVFRIFFNCKNNFIIFARRIFSTKIELFKVLGNAV